MKLKCNLCGHESDNVLKYVDFINMSENWFTHHSPFRNILLVPNTKEWQEKTIEGCNGSLQSGKLETPHGVINKVFYVNGITKPISVLG